MQETGIDRFDEDVEPTNEIEMNESDGGDWRAEECEGRISDCSGVDGDVDEDATDVEVDPPVDFSGDHCGASSACCLRISVFYDS